MKATLEFNLPEEREEFDITCNAIKTDLFLYEFEEWLRRKYKHEVPLSASAEGEYEAIVNKWFELKEI